MLWSRLRLAGIDSSSLIGGGIGWSDAYAGVVELVDTPDLGSGGLGRGGSSPSARTNCIEFGVFFARGAKVERRQVLIWSVLPVNEM